MIVFVVLLRPYLALLLLTLSAGINVMDGFSDNFSTFGMSTDFCLSTCSGEVAVDAVENTGSAECSEVDTVTLGATMTASLS